MNICSTGGRSSGEGCPTSCLWKTGQWGRYPWQDCNHWERWLYVHWEGELYKGIVKGISIHINLSEAFTGIIVFLPACRSLTLSQSCPFMMLPCYIIIQWRAVINLTLMLGIKYSWALHKAACRPLAFLPSPDINTVSNKRRTTSTWRLPKYQYQIMKVTQRYK